MRMPLRRTARSKGNPVTMVLCVILHSLRFPFAPVIITGRSPVQVEVHRWEPSLSAFPSTFQREPHP